MNLLVIKTVLCLHSIATLLAKKQTNQNKINTIITYATPINKKLVMKISTWINVCVLFLIFDSIFLLVIEREHDIFFFCKKRHGLSTDSESKMWSVLQWLGEGNREYGLDNGKTPEMCVGNNAMLIKGWPCFPS